MDKLIFYSYIGVYMLLITKSVIPTFLFLNQSLRIISTNLRGILYTTKSTTANHHFEQNFQH